MMSKKTVITLLGLILFATILHSCKRLDKKQPTNWRVNLNRNNKNPYGLFLTYNSLPYLFPDSKLEELKNSYQLTNLGYQLRKNEGVSLIIFIGINLSFSTGEIDSLISYVAAGHQVLLASSNFDDSLLARLDLQINHNTDTSPAKRQYIYIKDKNNQELPFHSRYKDQDISAYFTHKDGLTPHFLELGSNEQRHSDFIVHGIGKGKLFLHAAPIAFSNCFLLQQDNRTYLNTLFSYITDPVDYIYWSGSNNRQVYTSDWSVLWKHPATRYALLLALFALGIYLLFQMKRKQKIIPIIPPVENSSVAFVETTGRLYYNKKNHTNLSGKMIQHFLEFVRSTYLLNTGVLNSDFIKNLAAKSGVEITRVEALVHNIKEIQNGVVVDQAFLHTLYKEIQIFYHGK